MTDLIAKLSGIVSVLNTPFTHDDRIDAGGLAAHVEHAIETGAAGFLVPALASEVYKLTMDERRLLVQTTLETAGGRVPVIGGASAATENERLAAAAEWIALGCDGILVSVPYQGDADYSAQVERLAALEPGFLMLQDWDAQGDGLPIPLIMELHERIPAFRSIKIEVAQAGVKYTRLLEATQGTLHVAGGWAVTQMIEALDRGVHTLMPTGLNPLYTRIYHHYQAGERGAAKALFWRILPILAFSNQHLDLSIHFFKRLLHRQGLYRTDRVREPITPIDACQSRMADELIGYALDLMREIHEEETA